MKAIIAVALAVALPGAVNFRTVAAEITLASVSPQVARANPELTAARFMLEEARGRQLGAGRLMNPEVELSGRRMTEGREGGFSAALKQKFPVTARLRFEKAVFMRTGTAGHRRMWTTRSPIRSPPHSPGHPG